ncbi:bifunctional folylpolyglutamate synthase/dihydrofolate synthase [Microlunatus elymi]|uniref:Dihydrofolate synthase/folylpolyglutamate synthase n=1 Tax=Microlunatus elymi TaxID=2596828 RepID=A0A516PXL2_9ACTN|nr:folylpolyglutamate synthase/dihydrofolate synthase family protein [Microlunatus elymi]QDP95915.1 bifunctional folylpolyglutamate synthase/dihydrofolate synthase [Microlunatus elymi]
MSDSDSADSSAATHAEIVAALQGRWPEHRVAPSLGRVAALTELLGDPQRAYPVIQLTGTNGKGSTAAMIDALLRSVGLRTGRFTSPHLMDVTERIRIDGEPVSAERFDELWREVEPYVAMVDQQRIDGVAMTFFEVITAMAYAAFADAPVDVAVVEVGLGGTWDATNVADASVAVITPIDLDHTHLLGDTVEKIAAEKAGIIKADAQAILAGQQPEVARLLLQRAAEVGATVQREGIEFGVLDRVMGVGGQQLRLGTADGPIDEIFLPLYGIHQAENAALALAAAQAFTGLNRIDPDVVREGFAAVEAPGRLEIVRRSPPVILDAAHNPHGARATAAAINESFDFSPLVGVIAIMKDKDAEGLLREYADLFTSVVATQVASTDRGLPADELGELAAGIFGADRVQVAPRMDDAIEAAIGLAETEGATAPGVLITGSVVAVGEARTLLVGHDSGQPRPAAARVSGEGVLDAAGAPLIEDEGDTEDEKDYSYGPEYGEQFDEDATEAELLDGTGNERTEAPETGDFGAYGPLADDDQPGATSRSGDHGESDRDGDDQR